MTAVYEQVGEVQLIFMYFTSDRTRFKFINSRKETVPARKYWTDFSGQMPDGYNYFCFLTSFKPSLTSKTHSTYVPLGVLCTFADENQTKWFSQHCWEDYIQPLRNAPAEAKTQAYLQFATKLRSDYHGVHCEDLFNDTTYLLLQAAAEGNLTEAKKLAKAFTK